ncbi:MAG: c-type cytochrome biogenesis protein CcmI [Caulobacterales bacterium]
MIWLWIAAALISAAAGALIVYRAARAARTGGEANPSLAVYQRQMAEIDELASRGLLAESDRRGVRAETGRRLLAAAERRETPVRSARSTTILFAAAVAPVAAFALYLAVGAPGQPDQPFARRLADWQAAAKADPQSLNAPQLAAVLRARAAANPTDPTPLRYLALAENAAGQPVEALQALDKAIALAPRDPALWQMKGELSMMLAQGDLDANARDAFAHAAAIDPRAPLPRYFLARARIGDGDLQGGLADWKALEAELAPDDSFRVALSQEIAQVTATGRLTPAQADNGADQAVGTPQIQAMVDGLAQKLKANPDDPDGWVRLVRAYTVLGEAPRRDAALTQARSRYASRPEVLRQLDAATKPAP